MAWISVHTSIDGPKLRDLRKKLKCSKFEATGILVYVWFWGLENADKDGLILFAEKEDLEECIRGSGAGCKIPAADVVNALIETGWIDEADDSRFYIHDWEQWQDQWYKAKERRENDVKRKRQKRSQNESPQEPKKTGEGGTPPTPKPASKKEYSATFEEFWKVYPRSHDKGHAYEKYCARLKDGFSEEELLTAAKGYAAECKKNRTETKYIKLAATFLGPATPFVDFLPKSNSSQTTIPYESGDNPYEQWAEQWEEGT